MIAREKAEVRLRATILEESHNEFCSFSQVEQLVPYVLPCAEGNLIDGYVNGEIACQLDIGGTNRGVASLKSEHEEYRFLFQKIRAYSIAERDATRPRDVEPYPKFHWNGCNDVEFSVPVFPGAVMEEFEGLTESRKIRAVGFRNVVRLYRLKPVPQFLREWRIVYGVSVESIGPVIERKLNAVFLGGRIGAVKEYCCLIHRGIERGTELVEELAKFQSHVIFGASLGTGYSVADCPVAVHLYAGRVGFWVNDANPFHAESFSVRYGSFNS